MHHMSPKDLKDLGKPSAGILGKYGAVRAVYFNSSCQYETNSCSL
jgi:hypothetical protein